VENRHEKGTYACGEGKGLKGKKERTFSLEGYKVSKDVERCTRHKNLGGKKKKKKKHSVKNREGRGSA